MLRVACRYAGGSSPSPCWSRAASLAASRAARRARFRSLRSSWGSVKSRTRLVVARHSARSWAASLQLSTPRSTASFRTWSMRRWRAPPTGRLPLRLLAALLAASIAGCRSRCSTWGSARSWHGMSLKSVAWDFVGMRGGGWVSGPGRWFSCNVSSML